MSIRGQVVNINVTTEDLELIDFMLNHNEKIAKKMPVNFDSLNIQRMHHNLRSILKEQKCLK